MTGPLVAMFGREIQQYLLEHDDSDKIPKERMQFSVDCGRTSMGRRRIEQVYTQYVADDHDNDRMSQTSKRTRSPKRNLQRNPPWKQSSPAAHRERDADVRSQGSDRRIRDIREDPNYQNMKDNLSRPRGEDARRLSHDPREEQPRGSMARRSDYAHSEPSKLEPRHYVHKPRDRKSRHEEDRKPRHEEYDRDRRTDRCD